jgi:hypothetical protein
VGYWPSTDCHFPRAGDDPLGPASADNPPVVDRVDAGAFEGILRTSAAARFRHAQLAKGSMDKLLSGRSERIVVTMGMPALIYRPWFGADEEPDPEPLAGRHYAGTTDFDRPDRGHE